MSIRCSIVSRGRDGARFEAAMRRSQMVASPQHTVTYDMDPPEALCCGQLDAIFRTASAFPDAVVSMFPPDYDVSDDIRFVAAVREAAAFVEQNPCALVALGLEPQSHRPRGAGTWLLPSADAFLRPVHAELICHPDPFQWARLQRTGGLPATGSIVFHSTIMRSLVESRVPNWIGASCAALRDAPARHVRLGRPPFEFDRDIVASSKTQVLALGIRALQWSDPAYLPERPPERGLLASVRRGLLTANGERRPTVPATTPASGQK